MEEKILTHKDVLANNPHSGVTGIVPTIEKFVFHHFQKIMVATDIPWPNPTRDLLDKYVDAEVIYSNLPGRIGECGRWIARCITENCMGAEDVDPDEPIFMCCHCFNRGNGFKWLKIEMPKARISIEAVLLKRPAKNRFWNGETLAALKKENRDHGFEV